jgi:TIR domain
MKDDYLYDAFISHAVEDKIPIANELCQKLEQAGLKIWYSGRELNAGDSIATTIHDGLNKSRFGIVILSKNYVSKNWPLREFYHLLARENEGRKVILPVLYNINPEDLALKDLTMADRFAIKADKGLDQVVTKLLDVISHETIPRKRNNGVSKKSYIVVAAVLSLCGIGFWGNSYFNTSLDKPSKELIRETIQDRIESVNERINNEYLQNIKKAGGTICSIEKIDSLYTIFKNLKSSYRNEYEFYDGLKTIRSKKNVETNLQIDVESLYPTNGYNFRFPQSYVLDKGTKVKYALLNTQPLDYSPSDGNFDNDTTYSVAVKTANNIRYIEVDLIFNANSGGTKRHQMLILGFLPKEIYSFKWRNKEWHFNAIR